MTKLEKVIKGLQLCRYDPDPGQESKFLVSCDICPYWEENVGCKEIDLFNDALELLKEREPRVLTLEEATGEDECWFEFRPANTGRYADCYLHDNHERTRVYFTGKATMSLFDNADYNKTWRCWTAKPTDEQRKATPWDEPPKEEG